MRTDQPVVAFGGSYGGMLAAWLRMKYPASVQGAIAASAPILAFGKEYNSNSFWQVVTRDATPAAGAAPGCDTAVRSTWPVIDTYGATDAGQHYKYSFIFFFTPSPIIPYNLRILTGAGLPCSVKGVAAGSLLSMPLRVGNQLPPPFMLTCVPICRRHRF